MLRGALIGMTTATFFWSLRGLPLASATALFLMGPIIVVSLSAIILNEAVQRRHWATVAAGCAGGAIVLQPQLAEINAYALAALLSAILYALAIIVTRKLSALELLLVTAVWGNSTITILAAIAIASARWVPRTFSDLPVLMGMGIAGGLSNTFIIYALQLSRASVIAAFDYTGFLWALALGYMIFAEVLPWHSLIGGLLIVISGVVLALLEHRAERRDLS